MKVRQGFVSNSSSSSFVCDLTGECFGGYDGEYDVEVASCEAGHTFCCDGMKEIDDWFDENGRGEEIPKELCPICNGSAKSQLIERFKDELKRVNLTPQDLL